MAVSKSIGSQFPLETSESADEAVKISGTKRPVRSPPKSNCGSGHIVYVRRKPELELAKNNQSDAQTNTADCLGTKKSFNQDEATQKLMGKNEPVICVSDVAQVRRSSSPILSSTRSSVSPSHEVSSDNCTIPCREDPELVSVTHREDQCSRLQSLLETLDQTDQYEYVQMLRSLPSVELSRHAVELEKRSINLSLEEAKEMHRVRFVDVLGRYGKHVCTPSNLEDQLHK